MINDILGNPVFEGDFVIYAVSEGQQGAIRLGKVVGVSPRYNKAVMIKPEGTTRLAVKDRVCVVPKMWVELAFPNWDKPKEKKKKK